MLLVLTSPGFLHACMRVVKRTRGAAMTDLYGFADRGGHARPSIIRSMRTTPLSGRLSGAPAIRTSRKAVRLAARRSSSPGEHPV